MIYYEKGFSDFHFIISSGPTREFIDPVRFISNPSTGKMGYYLAMEALKYSPSVSYIHGPIDPRFIPLLSKNTDIVSTDSLLKAILKELEQYKEKKIILIMAAAPVDYRVKEISVQKIKKGSQSERIEFIPNPDILKTIRDQFKPTAPLYKMGFAAESEKLLEHGTEKLAKKDLDAIAINDISRNEIGFESDDNQVTLLTRDGQNFRLPLLHKSEMAAKLLELFLKTLKPK